MQEQIGLLYTQLGDPATAELNFSQLDGHQSTLDDIRTATASIPFLAERRLVVLTNPFARINKNDSEAQGRFTRLLESLPPFTTLVLAIEDTFEKKEWKCFPPSHWLRKWIEKNKERVKIEVQKLPDQKSMPGWITRRIKEKNGAIHADAAALLATYVDNDTWLADQEIEKLLIYTNFERPIQTQDVELLTANSAQANIFDLTDSLAKRNRHESLYHLCNLLERMQPLEIFAMFIYQFRNLLLAREIIDEGSAEQKIQQEMGLHAFVAQKLCRHARLFTTTELKWVYRRLLELDEQIKTGQISAELAMETLIAQITN